MSLSISRYREQIPKSGSVRHPLCPDIEMKKDLCRMQRLDRFRRCSPNYVTHLEILGARSDFPRTRPTINMTLKHSRFSRTGEPEARTVPKSQTHEIKRV
jgi:hypothetical protein